MPDPIQSSSSIPLPSYQTLKGGQDPLPPSSPGALNTSTKVRAEDDRDKKAEAFKEHLDKTSVTVVEKTKPKSEVDPAGLISGGSVYGQPGVTTPL